MKIKYGISNKLVRGVNGTEYLTVTNNVNYVYETLGSSVITVTTDKDINLLVDTSLKTRYKNYQLSISYTLNSSSDVTNYTIVNKNPTIANLNSSTNYVTALNTGYANIILKNKLTTINTSVYCDVSTGTYIAKSYLSDVFGSLRANMHNFLSTSIYGKIGMNPWGTYDPYNNPNRLPNKQKTSQYLGWDYPYPSSDLLNQLIYSTTSGNFNTIGFRDPTQTYVRSTSHILAGVDITGINNMYYDIVNTSGSCATVISPRHVFGAAHFHPTIGSKVQFVTNTNSLITRTIIDEVSIRSTANGSVIDHWVGLLDSDLPSTITPLKVLPTNYINYLPIHRENYQRVYPIPVYSIIPSYGIITVGNFLHDYDYSQGITFASYEEVPYGNVDTDNIASFVWNGPWGSGTPVCTVINNELVLLFCYFLAGVSGVLVSNNLVNTAMNTLSTRNSLISNYQLTTVNLTGFNTY